MSVFGVSLATIEPGSSSQQLQCHCGRSEEPIFLNILATQITSSWVLKTAELVQFFLESQQDREFWKSLQVGDGSHFLAPPTLLWGWLKLGWVWQIVLW